MATPGTPPPTPGPTPVEIVTKDAEKLAADAKTAESAAVPEIQQTAADVKADVNPVLADAHQLLDDIKSATNQLQVHELVEKLRALIAKYL